MKKTLLALFVFAAAFASGQSHIIPDQEVIVIPAMKAKRPAYNFNRAILPASLAFVSGASWGIHETCVNWPDRLPPSWNEYFWDNRVSWENKWKRGDDGELIMPLTPRYWGSTGILVATTDAKHLFASTHRWGMMGTGIAIGIGQRRPWWHYVADAAISGVAYGIGFQTSVFIFKL